MSVKRNSSKSREGPTKGKYSRDGIPGIELGEENEALTNEYLSLYQNYDKKRADLVKLANYIDCLDMNTYLVNSCVRDLTDRLYCVERENMFLEASPSKSDETSPEARPSEIDVEMSVQKRPSKDDAQVSSLKSLSEEDAQEIKENGKFCLEMVVDELELKRSKEQLKSAIDKFMPELERPVKSTPSKDVQTHQRKSGRKRSLPKKLKEGGPSELPIRRKLEEENEALKLHNTQLRTVVDKQCELLLKFEYMRSSKHGILDSLFIFVFLTIKEQIEFERTREIGDREEDWGDRQENLKLLLDIENVLLHIKNNAEKTVLDNEIIERFCVKVMVLRIRNARVSDAQCQRKKKNDEKMRSGKEITPKYQMLLKNPQEKEIKENSLECLRLKIQLSKVLKTIEMPQKLSLENDAEIEVEVEKKAQIHKKNIEKKKHSSDDIRDIEQLIEDNKELRRNYLCVNGNYAKKREKLIEVTNEMDCIDANEIYASRLTGLLQCRHFILKLDEMSPQKSTSKEDAQMSPVAGPSQSDVHTSSVAVRTRIHENWLNFRSLVLGDPRMPNLNANVALPRERNITHPPMLHPRPRKHEAEMKCDIAGLKVAIEKHIPLWETPEDSSSLNVQETCPSRPADRSKLREENGSLKYYNEQMREIIEMEYELLQILHVMWLTKHQIKTFLLETAEKLLDPLTKLEETRKMTESEIKLNVKKSFSTVSREIRHVLLNMECDMECTSEGSHKVQRNGLLFQLEAHNANTYLATTDREFGIDRKKESRTGIKQLQEESANEVSEVCETGESILEKIENMSVEIMEVFKNIEMPQKLSLRRDAETYVDEEKQAEHDKKDLDVAQDVGKSE